MKKLFLFFGLAVAAHAADATHTLTFDGVLCERTLTLKDIDSALPADWTGYTHLVVEMKTSTPQRFALWVYTVHPVGGLSVTPNSLCLSF